MVYVEKVKTGIRDLEKGYFLGNQEILEYFENIGAHHSDSLGYGLNSINETKVIWILLDWKVKVINKIKYGQELTIKTWSRSIERCYGNRDFEIYDENDNLCVIASSKWLLLNAEKGKIAKANDEMIKKYASEPDRKVFEDEKLEKLQIPTKFDSNMLYKIQRRDIDFNGHMHNLYYLNLAYEALPEEVYKNEIFNNVRINYKKEIKYGETVNCKYAFENNKHIVVIESEDGNTLHATIELS